MSVTKLCETKIKDVLKDNHEGKTYNDYEIRQTITEITTIVKKDHIVDHDTLTNVITQYIYCSGSKYYYNHKRKQTKKRDYIEKI